MTQLPISFVNTTPALLEPQAPVTLLSPPIMNDSFQEYASPSPRAFPPSPAPSQGEQRVSKARKGKRVHACEFPGCEKIFTRAEHRRRHELSHKSKKLYTCTYEGCTKAFHRSDYLSQHLARHDPECCKSRSSSAKSIKHTSPPVSVDQQEQPFPKSPILPGFQSPPASIRTAVSASPEQSMMYTSPPCQDCQHNVQHGVTSNSIYNYQTTIGHIPPSQIGQGIGSETVLDQYLRSVLRPEAFLAPSQPQSQMDSAFWANLDPALPSANPSSFQDPLNYSSWTSAPSFMPTSVTAHEMSSTPPPPPHQ